MVAKKSEERECTPQQRACVIGWIETGSMKESYRRNYHTKLKGQALCASAKKLGRRPQVRLLYDSLMAKHQKRHEVTVDRIVQEYAKMGFANMLDYMTVQRDGTAFCDLSELTRDQAAAIQEATFETIMSSDPDALDASGGDDDKDGRKKVAVLRTKFKLHDKKGPLDSMAKHLGMFEADNRQKGAAAGEALGQALSDVERARRIAFILRQAARTQAREKAAS